MTSISAASKTQPGGVQFLGIPLGDFGLFASLLLSFSLGFATFFGATFLAIVSLLIYNQGSHHAVNYADSYKWIGLPAGIAVLLLSLLLFGTLWIRRKAAGR